VSYEGGTVSLTHRAHTVRVVDAGERAGKEFGLDAASLELGGQRHQLGRVPGQKLEFVHGEDDRRLGGGLLELVGVEADIPAGVSVADKDTEVWKHRRRFDALQRGALGPGESPKFLEKLAKELNH
jgi:hypothetical protein